MTRSVFSQSDSFLLGGVYRLIMPNNDTMLGEFSEVLPNSRLRYSWQWVGSDEATEVEVHFESHPDGTEIAITHRSFQSAASLENHSTGWDNFVDGFRRHLENRA